MQTEFDQCSVFWDCIEGKSKLQVHRIHNNIDMTDLLLEFQYELNKAEGSVLLCCFVVKKRYKLKSYNRNHDVHDFTHSPKIGVMNVTVQ